MEWRGPLGAGGRLKGKGPSGAGGRLGAPTGPSGPSGRAGGLGGEGALRGPPASKSHLPRMREIDRSAISPFVFLFLSLPRSRPSGRGLYAPATGRITEAFKNALAEHDLDLILGDNAQAQPGNMQEVLLHETAVSWMRLRLARTTPQRSWLETREQYGLRLKRCCQEVNDELDVEGLGRDFPKRIKLLKDGEGRRIAH